MKKFWMAFAAFALIAVALPSCSDSDDPTPPLEIPEDPDNPNNPDDPDEVTAPFTLAVSNITSSDFSLSVTPNDYTGNYYVAAVSGAEEYSGAEIAEILIASDIEAGIDLGLVDNLYIYNGAASIPSLRSLWSFSAGSLVTVAVFGVSASGDLLTDVVTEFVPLLPLPASDFTLSIGTVTANTAEIQISGTPGEPFYIGLFRASDLASFDTAELSGVIIDAFRENIQNYVFALPEGQTSGLISYTGLIGNTSYTAVLFGIDTDALVATSEVLTETFTTPAGETPTGEFGTITVSNITDTTVDVKVEPSYSTTPYLLSVEYAAYVDQFANDSDLFAADMEYFYDLFADYISYYGSVYNIFVALDDALVTGAVEGQYDELDPGTEFCIYAYYMNSEETLTTTIGKAYFTTTGTATSSAQSVSLKSRKQVRSMPRNYVERLEVRPVVLGTAVSNDLAVKAPAFGKVR